MQWLHPNFLDYRPHQNLASSTRATLHLLHPPFYIHHHHRRSASHRSHPSFTPPTQTTSKHKFTMAEPIRGKRPDVAAPCVPLHPSMCCSCCGANYPSSSTPQNTPATNAPISSHAQQPGVASISEGMSSSSLQICNTICRGARGLTNTKRTWTARLPPPSSPRTLISSP